METPDHGTLERFAREHHLHYDVEPETADPGATREVVGFGVRLLASHGEGKLPAPGCPECRELLDGLRSFAEGLLASAGAEGEGEIVPEPAALFESTEERGADEVALTVRLRRADAPEPAGDSPESGDRRLAAVRERLEALGVPRRP